MRRELTTNFIHIVIVNLIKLKCIQILFINTCKKAGSAIGVRVVQ
jgi:hypothetical protein